ncbi:MAG: M15 family metallopeptidase, partial [Pseudomonadota bacterium]
DLKFIQSVMGEPPDGKQDPRVGRWLKVVGLLPAREHACLITSATPSAPSPQIALPVRRPDPPSGPRVRDQGQQSASLSPQSTDSVAPETDQRAQKASPASAGDPFQDVIPLPIPRRIWAAMQGKSWRRGLGCPRRGQLRYLRIPHWDFEGRTVVGEMIVARDVADDVLRAFAEIYRAQFAIERMDLVYRFDGNDRRSMGANNTSAFNCRPVTGGRRLSQHAYGRAIDVNPVQNPYVRNGRVQPTVGRQFATRAQRRQGTPGLIRPGGPAVRAFNRIGWKWGGYWRSLKDYQHFSVTGR